VGSFAKLLRAPLATSLLVAILVSLAVLALRGCGNLESLELAACDWFMKGKEERIHVYHIVGHATEEAENCKRSQQRVAHG
jgi:hypothetical protein